MNVSNTYLKFLKEDKTPLFVRVLDLLQVGAPIDEESGDDLELDSASLFCEDGEGNYKEIDNR